MPAVEPDVATTKVADSVATHGERRSSLIPVLQDLQEEFDYLPRESLESLAERLRLPLSEVLRVATFYAALSLEPRGEHLITVCTGTACHVRGAATILERLEDALGIEAGRTTPDQRFTLQTVNCLGACALGPVVVVDGRYFSNVAMPRVKGILREARRGYTRPKEPAAQASAR